MIPRSLVCIQDFHQIAKQRLSPAVYGYYAGGADSQATLRRNESEFSKIKLKQRVLIGKPLQNFSFKTKFFGKETRSPIAIAPSAMQKLAHPEGQQAVMKVAEKRGTTYGLSTLSHTYLQRAKDLAPFTPKIFQIYYSKHLKNNIHLIKRVEQAGYDAIAVTVDTPIWGNRYADIRTGFSNPDYYKMVNIQSYLKGDDDGKNSNSYNKDSKSSKEQSWLSLFLKQNCKLNLAWDDMVELRKITKLKIILKGVMCAQDAKISLEYHKKGIIDGIWVSNHGGRQLDQTLSTIEALPQIYNQIRGAMPILFDGGVRKGTDVLKALALGADFVLLGRPILWGLATNGGKGVQNVLDILEDELKRAMFMCGAKDVESIRRINVIHKIGDKIRPKL